MTEQNKHTAKLKKMLKAKGYPRLKVTTEPQQGQEHSQQDAGRAIGAGLYLSSGDCITVADQAESMKAMAISSAKAPPLCGKAKPPSGRGGE